MIRVFIHLQKWPDATSVALVIRSEITVRWHRPYGSCISKAPVFNES